MLTFGLYWFWFTAEKQRYYWDHTSFGTARLRPKLFSAEVEVEEEPPPVSIAPPPAPSAEEKITAEQSSSIPVIPEVEASLEEDSFSEPLPASPPLPEETEPAPATVDPAVIEQHIRQSVEEMMSQITDRIVRTVDPATVEQLVRKAVEDMMPQIVDRIARSVEIILRRGQQ